MNPNEFGAKFRGILKDLMGHLDPESRTSCCHEAIVILKAEGETWAEYAPVSAEPVTPVAPETETIKTGEPPSGEAGSGDGGNGGGNGGEGSGGEGSGTPGADGEDTVQPPSLTPIT